MRPVVKSPLLVTALVTLLLAFPSRAAGQTQRWCEPETSAVAADVLAGVRRVTTGSDSAAVSARRFYFAPSDLQASEVVPVIDEAVCRKAANLYFAHLMQADSSAWPVFVISLRTSFVVQNTMMRPVRAVGDWRYHQLVANDSLTRVLRTLRR